VLVQSVFKSMEWPTELRGHCPPFIAPKRNLHVGGVRDPDISGQEAGYVRETLLEPDLGARHVRCRDLTRFRSKMPDMC
jgi:hypothetical protein